MVFHSTAFMIFLPIVTIIYWLLPGKGRVAWLLAASCFFYMYAVPWYILIIMTMILLDFYAARWIDASAGRARRTALAVSIFGNAFLLIGFKYTGVIALLFDSTSYEGGHSVLSQWAIPIGLSFHTLQSVAYVVDVYRRKIKPERSLMHFALFVMFYPQMIAGPIERAARMLPQLHKQQVFSQQNMVEGGRLLLWGLFQKLVVADRLALVVDRVYDNPSAFSTLEVWMAAVLFMVQIYCDFSGYSDMARGSARLMGYELSLNFNHPLGAVSLQDFWSRWHITLTDWIRAYLLTPMTRKRIFGTRATGYIVCMFLFSGLWHGSSLTFVVWGLANAGVYLMERRWKAPLQLMPKLLQMVGNLAVVSFLCVLFRAPSLEVAWQVHARLLDGWFQPGGLSLSIERWQGIESDLWLSLALAVMMLALQMVSAARDLSYAELVRLPDRLKSWQRWTLYYAVLTGILLLGVFEERPFLYLQF
ncbi:MBOAT family protein [Paenibacillus sp. YYML68]|uniref:MBOAT family O-acyltransferase n=1 Tax=Paenibacillus sp. YYML68 TaxID=2909250 RepID=UPI002491A13B|nr:MBOAT family O-acyltransferase [Paenibacillus sp. YYML68]